MLVNLSRGHLVLIHSLVSASRQLATEDLSRRFNETADKKAIVEASSS